MGWQESLMYFLSTLPITLASGAVGLLAAWRDVRSELGACLGMYCFSQAQRAVRGSMPD